MIEVGIVGGTGYTGVELLRILALHPKARVRVITSRAEAGVAVGDYFPGLRGYYDLAFSAPQHDELAACDAVFFATPNGVAMQQASALLEAGVRVIDLSADFRLRDVAQWQRWYGQQHAAPQHLAEAVYGLPEVVGHEAIAKARLVANPGCYPTVVQLGLAPLLRAAAIEPQEIIANAVSGVSGAGRGAQVHTLFAEASDSFCAYGASGHRHLPEICQGLEAIHGAPVGLVFVPHLTPMVRGMHATLYVRPKAGADLQAVFEKAYAKEPFIDILPAGAHPQTRSVRTSNLCRLALHHAPGSETVIILLVIDNLVKGAAGQAVQNMNIMFNQEQTTGLQIVPACP